MYKTILVPVAPGHGPNTAEALRIARALRAEGGTITALTVIDTMPNYVAAYLPDDYEKTAPALALEALRAELGDAGDIGTKVVSGHAGQEIVEFANNAGVDCIVIASHRPGLQDYFLGSTASRVVRHATCAVHVVR